MSRKTIKHLVLHVTKIKSDLYFIAVGMALYFECQDEAESKRNYRLFSNMDKDLNQYPYRNIES